MRNRIFASYLGLQLNSPIIVGSSPMTLRPETVRELEIAGAGAIVLPSLFEEQIVHELIERGEKPLEEESLVESLSYDNVEDAYNGGPTVYLESIANLKSVTQMPVIASLNGCTRGKWLSIATEIQTAGADALEVTFESSALDPALSADEVEQRLLDCVSELCDQVSIPVTFKLSPFHSNLPNLAWRLTEAGASGLVCFAHDPVWEVRTDRIEATLKWSLTPSDSVNQTISGLLRVRSGGPSISLAASGGIATAEDIIKAVIAGADAVMLTSEIYREGPIVITQLLNGLANYLERHSLASFQDLVKSRPVPGTHIRGDYLKCLTSPGQCGDPKPEISNQVGDRWGHPR